MEITPGAKFAGIAGWLVWLCAAENAFGDGTIGDVDAVRREILIATGWRGEARTGCVAFGQVEFWVAESGDVGNFAGVEIGEGGADDLGALGVAGKDKFGAGARFSDAAGDSF